MVVRTRRRTTGKPAKQGLTVQTFTGLSKKRMEAKSGGAGNRIVFKEGGTYTVQPLQTPRDMREYYQHGWQEGGQWFFVPCTGDESCEPCQSENERKARKNYKFLANVYSFQEKKVQFLEGPKSLATQLAFKYQRKPALFTKRVYDITRMPTDPVSYMTELAEEAAIRTTGLKLLDMDEYLQEQLTRYYGDDGTPKSGRSALDDLEDEDFEDDDELDENEEEEDEDPDEDELMDRDAWPLKELRNYGREVGLKRQYPDRKSLINAITKKRGY